MPSSKRSNGFLIALWALALALPVGAAHAWAQDARVSGSVNFRLASGTFGSNQTTTIVYAPAVLRVDVSRFEFAGFFPYLSTQDAAGASTDAGWLPFQGGVLGSPSVGASMSGMMGGSGMMGSGTSQTTTTPPGSNTSVVSASGLGDLVGSAGYRFVDNILTGTQFLVSARVKIPTAASSQGLGTGRTDVGVAATLRKRYDSGWAYAELGFIVLGDPTGTDLRNAATWAVGGGKRISTRVYLLASAFGNTGVVSGYPAPAEVGAGLGVRLADHLNVTAIPSVGLTHASPRYAVTLGLSTDLWRGR